MKEVNNQVLPDVFTDHSKLELGDLERLELWFNAEGRGWSLGRTIVEENGSRTIYETFKVPLIKDKELAKEHTHKFLHAAGVLGYRSTIASFVATGSRNFEGFVWLFLERVEKT